MLVVVVIMPPPLPLNGRLLSIFAAPIAFVRQSWEDSAGAGGGNSVCVGNCGGGMAVD